MIANCGLWTRNVPDEIVIIAMGSVSFSVLGDRPWPRDAHAELLERLTDAGAKVVVFFESKDGCVEPDVRLLNTAAPHGVVVLPLLHDHERLCELLAEDT